MGRCVCWRVCPGPCRVRGRVRRCCGSAGHSSSTAASSEESSDRGSWSPLRSWSLADSIALVEGAPPAPVGETRRGAPWAGSSGNGVNRPGPSPTSPPSGGSGPGVGLGEVLQGPKGRLLAQRGAGAPGSSGGPPAVLVGNEPHGGADQVVPAQVWTTDWGQVATGRFGKAGEPVAFPRALRSPAGGAPSTIRRAPPRPCWTVRRTRGARQGGPLIGLDPDAPRAQQPVHGCSDGDAATAGGAPWWSARTLTRIAPGVDHGEGTPPKACAAIAGRRRTPRR